MAPTPSTEVGDGDAAHFEAPMVSELINDPLALLYHSLCIILEVTGFDPAQAICGESAVVLLHSN